MNMGVLRQLLHNYDNGVNNIDNISSGKSRPYYNLVCCWLNALHGWL